MAKRRFQDPKPFKEGQYWWILYYEDYFNDDNGKLVRKRKRKKLGSSDMLEAEAKRMAAECIRPMNQGDQTLGSATKLEDFIETIYMPHVKKKKAKTTYGRSRGILDNYLLPVFGKCRLRDLTSLKLQSYFDQLESDSEGKALCYESRKKIRDVFSSAMRFAQKHNMAGKNPLEVVEIPPDKYGKKRAKPYLTPAQFTQLVEAIPEPYASMLFVAIYTGLRVSELIGLKWDDVLCTEHRKENGETEIRYAISVDERFCRGDWGPCKSEASNATIGINRCVFERIHRLKLLTVEGRAGRATRRYRVVKSSEPTDLVFQSVRDGKPMRDNNILVRFIKPAARKVGGAFLLPKSNQTWVNWRTLRTSHATWLKMAGADIKDAQAQLRHSRASTTLDFYQQSVAESQYRAIDKLTSLPV